VFSEKQLELTIKKMLEKLFYNRGTSAVYIQFNQKKEEFYYSLGKKNKKDKSIYSLSYNDLPLGLQREYSKEYYEHARDYNYKIKEELDPHKLRLSVVFLKLKVLSRLLIDYKKNDFKDISLAKDIDKKVKQIKEFSKKTLKQIVYTKPFKKDVYPFSVKYEGGRFIKKKEKESIDPKDLQDWTQIVYFVDQLEKNFKTKKQLTRDFQEKLIERFCLLV